jgi:hypothetical protein
VLRDVACELNSLHQPGTNRAGDEVGAPVVVLFDVPKSQWLAENVHAFANYDGFPVSPEHALVVTKRIVATGKITRIPAQRYTTDGPVFSL